MPKYRRAIPRYSIWNGDCPRLTISCGSWRLFVFLPLLKSRISDADDLGSYFGQRRGRFGLKFGFAAAFLPCRPSPPIFAGRSTYWTGWSIVLERSDGLTRGVTLTNAMLPPQSKRRHYHHRGRRRQKNTWSRPCLVPPLPPSLLILFNSVVAPNFVGDCMSQGNFAILSAVKRGYGYVAANRQRLILSVIRSIHLQQRQKRSRRCLEINVVLLHSFHKKPFYYTTPVLYGGSHKKCCTLYFWCSSLWLHSSWVHNNRYNKKNSYNPFGSDKLTKSGYSRCSLKKFNSFVIKNDWIVGLLC